MKNANEFIISEADKDKRLDHLLFAKKEIGLSRSQIQKLIKDEHITLNGQAVKSGYKVKEKDKVKVEIPPLKKLETIAENIPLDIVFEDEDLIVINKPRGMVAHPAAGNFTGTLVNALLHHCKNLSGIGGVERPGIVHRLDKDTSGLMVIAKNDFSHQALVKQFKDRKVKKVYLALVRGIPDDKEGEIEIPIGRHRVKRKKMAVGEGKEARTHYCVIKTFRDYSLLEVTPKTGRTHQIRVHLHYIGHPIVGDEVYGGVKGHGSRVKGQMLHATKLGFIHPRTEKYVEFERPMPEDMQKLINNISRNSA